jgi:transposase-like protein
MANKTSMKYSPEVRERAVRLVFEHQGERAPQWAVIGSITAKTGCTAETLRDRTISVMKGAYPSHGTSSAQVREAMHFIKAARCRFRPILLTLDQAAIPCRRRSSSVSTLLPPYSVLRTSTQVWLPNLFLGARIQAQALSRSPNTAIASVATRAIRVT